MAAAALVGPAYVVIVGLVEVQQRAALNGVVVSWGNRPIAVGSAHVPVLQYSAIAVATVALVLIVVAPSAPPSARRRVRLTVAAVALLSTAVGGLSVDLPTQYAGVEPTPAEVLTRWWAYGSSSAATHVAVVLLAVAAARAWTARQGEAAPETR